MFCTLKALTWFYMESWRHFLVSVSSLLPSVLPFYIVNMWIVAIASEVLTTLSLNSSCILLFLIFNLLCRLCDIESSPQSSWQLSLVVFTCTWIFKSLLICSSNENVCNLLNKLSFHCENHRCILNLERDADIKQTLILYYQLLLSFQHLIILR